MPDNGWDASADAWIAEMGEAAFHEVQKAGVAVLDIFDELEQDVFHRDLTAAGVCGGLVGHGCLLHGTITVLMQSSSFAENRW